MAGLAGIDGQGQAQSFAVLLDVSGDLVTLLVLQIPVLVPELGERHGQFIAQTTIDEDVMVTNLDNGAGQLVAGRGLGGYFRGFLQHP